MRVEKIINTLKMFGVLDATDEEEIGLLEDFDVHKIYKRLRKLLIDTGVEISEVNKSTWRSVLELCKLCGRRKLGEVAIEEFLHNLEETYWYMYIDYELRNPRLLENAISYMNMTCPMDIEDIEFKIIQGSAIALKYNKKQIKLTTDVYFDNGNTVMFFKPNGRLKGKSVGYGVRNDDSLKTYEVSTEGLIELLNDVLNFNKDFRVIYTTSMSVVSPKIEEYLDIHKMSNKNFLYLLRLISQLSLHGGIDLEKYKMLEDTDKNIKELVLSLCSLGNLRAEVILSITYDLLEKETSNEEINEIVQLIAKKRFGLRTRSLMGVSNYEEFEKLLK